MFANVSSPTSVYICICYNVFGAIWKLFHQKKSQQTNVFSTRVPCYNIYVYYSETKKTPINVHVLRQCVTVATRLVYSY